MTPIHSLGWFVGYLRRQDLTPIPLETLSYPPARNEGTTEMGDNKIRFNDVCYRQGFLEVTANIHPGHINLETWEIHPDIDISETLFGEATRVDSVTANTEIELSVQQAKALIASLEAAIALASGSEGLDCSPS